MQQLYCRCILRLCLHFSDSHLEAKNGFGLHTEQVNQRHKIQAFKVSQRDWSSSCCSGVKLTGTVVLRSPDNLQGRHLPYEAVHTGALSAHIPESKLSDIHLDNWRHRCRLHSGSLPRHSLWLPPDI